MNTKPSYILLFHQEWSAILSSKHDFFTAIAQYHQARLAKDKGSYGEGVARFQLAEKLMATVAKNSMGLIEFKVCCALKLSCCHVVLNMITFLASCHALCPFTSKQIETRRGRTPRLFLHRIVTGNTPVRFNEKLFPHPQKSFRGLTCA